MENERNKPDCPLIGQDGNVFNLIGMASRTLKDNGMAAEAKEMSSRVFASGSYDEALSIIGEYVNITSADEPDEDIDEEYEEDFGMEMSFYEYVILESGGAGDADRPEFQAEAVGIYGERRDP